VTRLLTAPVAVMLLAATAVGAALTTAVCVVMLAFAEDVDCEVELADDGGDLPACLGRCR
jgi:hypothetical protein